MKKDKIKELRAKSLEELHSLYPSLKEKLELLRFDLKSGKTAVIKEIRELKKEIAVILTLIKEKEYGNKK
jgi:ribosomal protein L29